MSLTESLNAALNQNEENRDRAHQLVDESFDGIKASLETAIAQMKSIYEVSRTTYLGQLKADSVKVDPVKRGKRKAK